jgi:hypothetical protein
LVRHRDIECREVQGVFFICHGGIEGTEVQGVFFICHGGIEGTEVHGDFLLVTEGNFAQGFVARRHKEHGDSWRRLRLSVGGPGAG